MSGHWWLPGTEGHRRAGTLNKDADGFVLVTDGSFEADADDSEDAVHFLSWASRSHEVIWGELDDGVPVTLLDASGLIMTAPLSVRENWHPRVALVGIHLDSGDDKRFTRAVVQLQHLDGYAGSPQIGLEVVRDISREVFERISLDAERVLLESAEPEGEPLNLVVQPGARTTLGKSELWVDVLFELETETPRSWSEAWQRYALPLQALIVILAGRFTRIESFILKGPDIDGQVKVLLRMKEPIRPVKAATPHDFLATSSTMPAGFRTAMQQWWTVYKEARFAIREIVDVESTPYAYVEDKLLAYVRAVPALLTEESKAVSKNAAADEDQEWLARVGEALPDDLRAGVLARISVKGPSDRNRLVALIDDLGSVGAWLTGGNAEGFAQNIVVTRHQFTHPSSSGAKKALQGESLVSHTRALGWLLRAAILKRLGMDTEVLFSRLRRTPAVSAADEMSRFYAREE